jgi:hypothetical protein
MCRREDNIIIVLRELACEAVDLNGLGWGTLVGFCEHGNETWGSITAASFLTN